MGASGRRKKNKKRPFDRDNQNEICMSVGAWQFILGVQVSREPLGGWWVEECHSKYLASDDKKPGEGGKGKGGGGGFQG